MVAHITYSRLHSPHSEVEGSCKLSGWVRLFNKDSEQHGLLDMRQVPCYRVTATHSSEPEGALEDADSLRNRPCDTLLGLASGFSRLRGHQSFERTSFQRVFVVSQDFVVGTDWKPVKVVWRAMVSVENCVVPLKAAIVGKIAVGKDFEVAESVGSERPASKIKHVFVSGLPLSGTFPDKLVAGHLDV